MSDSTCSWLYMPYAAESAHSSTIARQPVRSEQLVELDHGMLRPPAGGAMLTRRVSHPATHTGGVDVLIGTAEGLLRLSDGCRARGPAETAAIDGEWAIVEDSDVVSLDGGVTATTAPLPHSASPFGDGALVGTEEAHVFVVDANGAVTAVESFDRIPTRDTGTRRGARPPAPVR